MCPYNYYSHDLALTTGTRTKITLGIMGIHTKITLTCARMLSKDGRSVGSWAQEVGSHIVSLSSFITCNVRLCQPQQLEWRTVKSIYIQVRNGSSKAEKEDKVHNSSSYCKIGDRYKKASVEMIDEGE